MERAIVERYLNKKIKIFLKNKLTYTGVIENIVSGSVRFIDKYGDPISFECELIEFIQPAEEGSDKDET